MNCLLDTLRRWMALVLIVILAVCLFNSEACAVQLKPEDSAVVVEQGLLRVEAPKGLGRYAENVLGHATAAMRSLNQSTGDALLVRVRFVVADTEARFLELTGSSGEQSLAVAFGGEQLVVISRPAMVKSGSDRIHQVLVHELAHVYLDVKCKAMVPRWVHEGVAQIVSGQWTDAPGEGTMAISAYTGGLLPLRDLVVSFPSDVSQRNLAYAESFSAMRFVVRERHENSLRHFLASVRGEEGKKYLESLAGGIALDALDQQWQGRLRSPVFLTTVFLGSSVFWGLGAILVVVAWVLKRRHSKVLREEWKQEDALHVDLDEWTQIEDGQDKQALLADPEWTPDEPDYEGNSYKDDDNDGVGQWR